MPNLIYFNVITVVQGTLMTIKKMHLVVYTLLLLVCPPLHGKKSIQKLSRLELEFVIAKQFCKKYKRELEIEAIFSLISIASWADRRLEAYYSNSEYEKDLKKLRQGLAEKEIFLKVAKQKHRELKEKYKDLLEPIENATVCSPTISIRKARNYIANITEDTKRGMGGEIKIQANKEWIKHNEMVIAARNDVEVVLEELRELFDEKTKLEAKLMQKTEAYSVHKTIQKNKYYNSFRYPFELTIMGINVFDLLNLVNEYRRFRSQFIDALEKGGNLSL